MKAVTQAVVIRKLFTPKPKKEAGETSTAAGQASRRPASGGRSKPAERVFTALLVTAVVMFSFAEPAFAQSTGVGLAKVSAFMDSILAMLRAISVTVVTGAIIWCGFKLLWTHAGIEDVAKIGGGALMVGGAAEFARYMLA